MEEDDQASGGEYNVADFKPVRFESQLKFPAGTTQQLQDAAKAVRQELQGCSKWKRLTCRKISIVAERDRGTVCVVHIGSSVEFDWTWEGAVAFRPESLADDESISNFYYETTAYDDDVVWSGEILEVDERNGCLYISLDNPESVPTTGSFFVRPFEFLSGLDAVYNDPKSEVIRGELPARLAAAEGGVHPKAATSIVVGLANLSDWWQHSWSVLWGPPGTGKTYTTGQQIAGAMLDEQERILVVSTTNRATDAVATSIGTAAKSKCQKELADGQLVRIGKGASTQAYSNVGLEVMLRGTEAEALAEIDQLGQQLRADVDSEDKALTRKQIGKLRANTNDQSRRIFVDPEVRVVVATSFKAMSFLNDETITAMVENGEAPFTTIFIDEAGLISRAAIAALSFLASRRVVLVGDSKQLAPISKISRLLPTRQKTWVASSGLSHLDDLEETPTAVHVLTEQHRMHPDVCNVVSNFHYGGFLTTADETENRNSDLPSLIAEHSRAIWYVLDEEGTDLASIRAEKGPSNKSWVRPIVFRILQKLFSDEGVKNSDGLFISPYKPQAQAVGKQFGTWGVERWEASTVHSQQGSEADIVIFDTVNAGSSGWPPEEWKRLVNVALSRAREAVIVIASRSEMTEPHLRPLLPKLSPSVLVQDADGLRWQSVCEVGTVRESKQEYRLQPDKVDSSSNKIGDQINARKPMVPVLSKEQQRLSDLDLDGKPRLVRGVAGSGKSLVLSNWLAKTAQRMQGKGEFCIWAVYANRSLHKLLRDSIEFAWQHLNDGQLFEQDEFPWGHVHLLHVKDVLDGVLPSAGMSAETFGFAYDKAAEMFLSREGAEELLPRCDALFVDEAQDMGPAMLKLLVSMVEQSDPDDENSRPAHIFYDNAQNIYGRGTPKWSDFGLDMRGRSTIMKESFRSTQPITEIAVNVLQRLGPDSESPDQKELLSLGLLERCQRNGGDWLNVRFNQVNGPKPIFRKYSSVEDEMQAIGTHLTHLIQVEGISPEDICLIYNGKSVVPLLESKLGQKMADIGVELSVQTSRSFERKANTLVITTCHSFKGYEAEVILIPCADQYVAGNEILANNLYVAMTRARSLLAAYSLDGNDQLTKQLNDTFEWCIQTINSAPVVEAPASRQDDVSDILEQIGVEHRKWLEAIFDEHEVSQEPITSATGAVLAEPLFWFRSGDKMVACFDCDPPAEEQQLLSKSAFSILTVGD